MHIDITTIILTIGVAHLMQLLVFFYQFKANKLVKGPGWWLAWSGAEAFAFILILFRNIPVLQTFVISIQDIIIITGTLFINIGLLRFFDKPVKKTLIITLLVSFSILHLSFLYIHDSITLRSLFFNIYISITGYLAAIIIYRNKSKSIATTANFNSWIFIIHGSIFAHRSVCIMLGIHHIDMYELTFFNLLQYFDALIVGLLWTFGLIIMLNQRLNGELQEAKNHFEQIFNTSPDAVVITRMTDGLFVDCNENYSKITGYAKYEVIGQSTINIRTWNDIADRNEVISQVLTHGFCENKEVIFCKKDGSKLTGLISAKLITLKDIPHIISVIRDITDRKRVELEIHDKNRELQKVNKEKDTFFTIISHDLKTPLSSIVGFSELLIKKVEKQEWAKVTSYATIILQSSRRAIDLLTNLMDWSRAQTGRMQFSPTEVDLTLMIEQILNLYQNTAEQKSIKIKTELPQQAVSIVDKDMISTVIRNLISNAIKFTRNEGVITVSLILQENQTLIKVKDTGIGIKEEIINKLFQLEDNYTTRGTNNEEGTGLGLLLCKEFILKHGGQIWVESEVEKGSTFTFSLPIR